MPDRLETRFAALPPLRRMLMLWTVAGALVHAAVPALHAAVTPVGPIALWLWLLPLAALGFDLLASPPVGVGLPATALPESAARRRRTGAGSLRQALSRRDRLRPSAKAQPAARRVRRAG